MEEGRRGRKESAKKKGNIRKKTLIMVFCSLSAFLFYSVLLLLEYRVVMILVVVVVGLLFSILGKTIFFSLLFFSFCLFVFKLGKNNGKVYVCGRQQNGILRTSCIDSLDRTNAAHFIVGKVALGEMLYAIGYLNEPELTFTDPIVELLMEMYAALSLSPSSRFVIFYVTFFLLFFLVDFSVLLLFFLFSFNLVGTRKWEI